RCAIGPPKEVRPSLKKAAKTSPGVPPGGSCSTLASAMSVLSVSALSVIPLLPCPSDPAPLPALHVCQPFRNPCVTRPRAPGLADQRAVPRHPEGRRPSPQPAARKLAVQRLPGDAQFRGDLLPIPLA